jgi:hypothetical protein
MDEKKQRENFFFINKGGMEMTSSHTRIEKNVKENQPPEFENELL